MARRLLELGWAPTSLGCPPSVGAWVVLSLALSPALTLPASGLVAFRASEACLELSSPSWALWGPAPGGGCGQAPPPVPLWRGLSSVIPRHHRRDSAHSHLALKRWLPGGNPRAQGWGWSKMKHPVRPSTHSVAPAASRDGLGGQGRPPAPVGDLRTGQSQGWRGGAVHGGGVTADPTCAL